MFKALLKIRLSYYFVIFLIFYTGLLMFIPKPELPAAGLTLFSINSFLFGFYFTPILNNQKAKGIWNPLESLLDSDFRNLENKDDQA